MDTLQEIFGVVVSQCPQAGLIRGENLVADGTQIRARASVRILERQVYAYCESFREDQEDEDDNSPPDPSRQAGDPDFRGNPFAMRPIVLERIPRRFCIARARVKRLSSATLPLRDRLGHPSHSRGSGFPGPWTC